MATIPNQVAERSPSVGRVFNRTFSVMSHNPVVVFGTSLVVSALPYTIAAAALRPRIGGDVSSGATSSTIIGSFFILALLYIGLRSLVQGCLVRATIADSEGRTASLGECIRTALPCILPLIGASVLLVLAVGLGFILLFVPGVIVMLMFSVVVPVVVAERAGIVESFRRSAYLTAGARWKILGLFLLIAVLSWLLAAVTGLASGTFSGRMAPQFSIGAIAWNAIVNTLVTSFWCAAQTALYVELRDWKDGPGTDRLGEIFE